MGTLKTYTETETSNFTKVGNTKIHYHDAGQGDVVIMLHGSGPGASGWSNFNRNIDALAEKNRVICVDMPGWGNSDPRDKGISLLSWFADKIVGLMDNLEIEKASFIGNSLGGNVAMKLALEYPDRTEKLILMGASIGFSMFGDSFPPAIRDIIFFYEGDGPSLEKLKSFASNFVYDPSTLPDDLLEKRLVTAMKFVDNPPMRFGPGDSMEPLWRHPKLGELKNDVLLIWGREDKVVPLDRGLSVLTLIPKARLMVLPKCGHWAQWEHAEEFNRVVGGFIDG